MPEDTDTQQPAATAQTTPPKNTFVKAPYSFADGVLLYRPEDNSFIALYGDEWPEIRAAAWEAAKPIRELQEANQTAAEKAVALRDLQKTKGVAKQDLKAAADELATALNEVAEKSEAAKTKIEPVKTLDDDNLRLIELVPLTKKRPPEDADEKDEDTEPTNAKKKKKKSKSEEDGISRKRLFTPIYVPGEKIKRVLADKRVYVVDGEAERKKSEKEKIFSSGKINTHEVKKRILDNVQDKAGFSIKWKLAPKDEDEYSGILGDWAKTMGADARSFLERKHDELMTKILPSTISHDKNDPYRNIDLKSDAQLMRWAAGAGLEANFSPFQGSLFDKRDKDWGSRLKRAAKAVNFGIKANAEASFAVGEAKVETIVYLPHYTGWEMSPAVLEQPFNFGYFRLQGDLLLYGMAGASIALDADIGMMLTAGKQGVKGTAKGKKGAKAKVGAKADIALFAGLKEGVTLSGAFQWLNPEGVLGTSTPKQVKPDQAIAEYADIAKVSGTAEAIEGLAAKLGFECAFRNGRFRVAGDIGGCLGLGGGGKLAAEVGVATIADFFMCVCHILKQADYEKLRDVMEKRTFDIFNQILFLVEADGKQLQAFAESTEAEILGAYRRAIDELRRRGKDFLQRLEQRMRSGWGWFAYMPPEARGAVMMAINDARLSAPGDREAQLAAAFCVNEILSTLQTPRHLDKTLERMTYNIGETRDNYQARDTLASILDDTQFSGGVELAKSRLADAKPLIGRPFLRNDQPSIVVATLPLHGTIYTTDRG
jgi:hypothetical protein